jgi:endoribonuclease LACTB2
MKPINRYVDITLHDNLQLTTSASRAFLKRIGIEGQIIATPGHSDDSVTLSLDDGSAFTGDLPSPNVVDESTLKAVTQSWDRLRALYATTVYPGHGAVRPLPAATGATM